MSKRTLFLIFALFLITFVLLMMALYKPQSSKTAQIVPTPVESITQTTLSFGKLTVATSSSTLRQPAYRNYSLPIEISTGKNKVTTVQLELMYDTRLLTNVAITPGSFFTKPNVLLDKIDVETGRVSYALSIGPTGQASTGKSVVANLTFSVKTNISEEVAIIFLPKTLVTAEGINDSVLKQAINGLFEIGEKPSTPSATKLTP